MNFFLEDYQSGLLEGRYISYQLPERMEYPDNYFDLGLSSHFLLLYSSLGEEFHQQAMEEMIRVCKEVRIFPVVDLDGNETQLSWDINQYFSKIYRVEVIEVPYQFQKNGNRMMRIKKG